MGHSAECDGACSFVEHRCVLANDKRAKGPPAGVHRPGHSSHDSFVCVLPGQHWKDKPMSRSSFKGFHPMVVSAESEASSDDSDRSRIHHGLCLAFRRLRASHASVPSPNHGFGGPTSVTHDIDLYPFSSPLHRLELEGIRAVCGFVITRATVVANHGEGRVARTRRSSWRDTHPTVAVRCYYQRRKASRCSLLLVDWDMLGMRVKADSSEAFKRCVAALDSELSVLPLATRSDRALLPYAPRSCRDATSRQ